LETKEGGAKKRGREEKERKEEGRES